MPRKKEQEPQATDARPKSKNPESEGFWPSCCWCGKFVSDSGYCHLCARWPINITPIRYCNRAHRVNPDGWCQECSEFVQTELLPGKGEWRDTQRIPRRLTKQEVQTLARDVADMLSTPGWPEKEVPLNRRFIPRRWKREKLIVLGHTPNGDEIVIPERCVPAGMVWRENQWQSEEMVPF